MCAVSFRSPYLGKATAAITAVLTIPTRACSVFVFKQSYGCQCLGLLMCTWMLMLTQGLYRHSLRESALNIDWERKNPLLYRAVEPVSVWHLA